MIWDPARERLFTASRQQGGSTVHSFDRNGVEQLSRPTSLEEPVSMRLVGDRLYLSSHTRTIEVDADTLLEIRDFAVPAVPGAFPPFPELVLQLGLTGNEYSNYIRIDALTGAQDVVPRDPSLHRHGEIVHLAMPGRALLAGTSPTILVDTTVFPPIPIASFAGELVGRPLADGSFLTVTPTEVVRRSDVDGGELSRTQVGDADRATLAYAPDADVVAVAPWNSDEVRLYRAGAGLIASVRLANRGLAALEIDDDARRLFVGISNAVWVLSTALPQPHPLQELWQPTWYDELTLVGSGFEGVTRAVVNGVEVGFAVEASGGLPPVLRLDVSGFAPSPSARVVLEAALGGTTVVLPASPPRGMSVVSVRLNGVPWGDSAVIDCRDVFGRYRSVRMRFDDSLERQIALVPALADCRVEGPVESRGVFVDPDGRRASVDVWGETVHFESGAPAHLEFVPGSDRVMWVFTFPAGDPPPDTRYRVRVTCGEWSASRRVDAGFGVRFEPPASAARRCTVRMTDKEGAESVRSVEIAPATASTGGRSLRVRRGTNVGFIVDHGGVDWQAPLAVGAPGERIGKAAGAGVVHLFPTATDGRPGRAGSSVVRQGAKGVGGKARAGERFGEEVAVGDFNSDGWVDVAIGVPGDRVRRKRDVGSVHVLFGGPNGFDRRRSQLIHRGLPGVPGPRAAGDGFGSALAVVDFNGDGWDDLAVGVPGSDVDDVSDAGEVHVFFGGPAGLRMDGVETLRQGHAGLNDRPEAHDRFGLALGGSGRLLVIGVPFEDVGRKRNAGVIHLVDGLTGVSERLSQKEARGERRDTGDRFGAAIDVDGVVVVVGAPGEDRGGRRNVGVAHAIHLSDPSGHDGPWERFMALHSMREPVAGAAFGSSVAASSDARADLAVLAIGAPGAAVSGRAAAGVVQIDGLEGSYSTWTQSEAEVPGAATAGNGFGSAVTFGPWGSLVVGLGSSSVSGKADAGQVFVTSNLEDWHVLHQDRRSVPRAATAGDNFGHSVAG